MALKIRRVGPGEDIYLRLVPAGRMICEHELVQEVLQRLGRHYPDMERLLPLARNIALLSLALCDGEGRELYTPRQVEGLFSMEQIARLAAVYKEMQEEGEYA